MPITQKNKEDIKKQIEFFAKLICEKNHNLKVNEGKLSNIFTTYAFLRDNIKKINI